MLLIWTPNARKAARIAISRVAQTSPAAARRLAAEIEHQTALLLQHPYIGRTGRLAGTRELVISRTPYLVVYRVIRQRGQIQVLHFLHSAQLRP